MTPASSGSTGRWSFSWVSPVAHDPSPRAGPELTCWSYPPAPATGVAAEAIEAAGAPWTDDVPVTPFRACGSPEAFGSGTC